MCSNDPSMMGVTEEGTVRQRRVVTPDDVVDYASHIEPDQVKSRSEDYIEYKAGLLLSSSGTTSISIMPEVSAGVPVEYFS